MKIHIRRTLSRGNSQGTTPRTAPSTQFFPLTTVLLHGPKKGIGRVRPHAKFIHICLPCYCSPSLLEKPDDGGIVRTSKRLQSLGSGSGGKLGSADVVLDSYQKAVECIVFVVARYMIGRVGIGCNCGGVGERDESVEVGMLRLVGQALFNMS